MKSLLFTLLAVSSLQAATQITWKRQQLHGDFYAEGAAIGDINGDGKPDVVSGPFWWEGPAFEKRHAFYEPKIFSINGYSDNFFAYVHDFNADQKNDILVLGFPGKEARLYVNPGTHDDKPWAMHIVADVVDNESPVFTDITGDGKPEIVCSTGGQFGWFAPNWDKPTEKWPFVAVTDDMKVAKFTHGLGVGDVNGDGKADLLEARRWWEQPTGNSEPKTAKWLQHNFAAGVGGGAQMFAYDFDGNGTNDVFTSLAAHRYGVAVFLQNKSSSDLMSVRTIKTSKGEANVTRESKIDADGTEIPGTSVNFSGPNWTRIMLASEQPQDNDYGIVFSQPHAAYLADIDGDGIKDIVTGKRYWAHNGHDPDERGARVIYWYQTMRDGKGGVDFVPHLVDAESGVGVDVQVGDVNGDKLPDIVVGNKAGVYILTQERKETTADLTPKKLYGPALKPQKDYAKGQSAADALKSMQLPGGFKAELIAAEPDVVQPIAFTFDERGRIWVVEGNSYPKPREVGQGQDRIKILEDKDGDGTFETKKIFCEGLNLVSGIELGFGGVWVGAAPYLMFIPDKDHDDKPDAVDATRKEQLVPGLKFTAYALLDGWGSQDTHETLNSFIWGPDGWLYGCHGVFTHSKVGKPGTPDDQRQPINAGIWRYHPVRHEFEIFAHGTSNPWGLDYDQHGEWFVTACVIPHLYHIVPGGRYQRQAGQHFNAYTYDDIKTIADHAHYAGSLRPDINFDKTTGAGLANNDTNALGGGHAHCGLAIYQSSQFPPTYRNQLIFGNLHGHRLVANYTDPKGSTYTGKHGADFLRANDMHFIPVTQKVGPDGSLYVSDWSDQQICHRGSNAVENWDRSNGRIYRISYVGVKASADLGLGGETKSSAAGSPKGLTPTSPFDLAKKSDETLAKLAVQTENEWFSRMARKILMERAVLDTLEEDKAIKMLVDEAYRGKQTSKRLHAMWGLHCLAFNVDNLTSDFDEQIRVWAIRSFSDSKASTTYLKGADRERALEATDTPPMLLPTKKAVGQYYPGFAHLLDKAASPMVRREYASLLQSIPYQHRKDLATALLKHGEDKDDPMIPLLIWYGVEPVVAADASVGLQLASVSKLPKVTEFIYRRMASEEAGRQGLLKLAAEAQDNAQRDFLLQAILTAARGGSKITQPANWAAMRERFVGVKTSADSGKPGSPKGLTPTSASQPLLELEAHMGIESALKYFRDQLALASAATAEREHALNVLIQARDAATSKVLLQLVQGDAPGNLKRKAVQALASLKDLETPQVLSAALTKLPPGDVPDAINTLASTKEGSVALLKAVEAKTVPATSLSPFLVRQLAAFKDPQVDALIKSAWGDVNAPKADLAERTKKYRDLLTPAALAKGDVAKGKTLFMATCGACHQLFGEGQNVGPDITGSNRADLNYLLENVLDPNAVIGKAYQLNLFTMKDGRVMSGVIKEENPAAVKIAMMGGIEFTLPQTDIAKREVSKLSTMPEGLFDALPPAMVIDLVAYLQSGSSLGASAKTRDPRTLASAPTAIAGALEGESLKILETTGGKARVQGMGGFGNRWSGGSQLWWTGGKPDDKLTLAIPVKESGKYTLHGVLTMAKDYGVTSITLDGKPIASSFDGFNADKVILTDERDWGTHELTAGDHQLTFTLAPPNPAAKPGNMVGLDYVRLEKK